MPALNRVQLIGRLGLDPKSMHTKTGKQITSFSIAINNRRKNEEGEVKEFTEWINIETWEKLADFCQNYLHKGSLVYLEGRIKTDKYEDKDGEKKYYTKVVATLIQMLDKRAEGDPITAVHDEKAEYITMR